MPLHRSPQLLQRFPELFEVLLTSIVCSPCINCALRPDRQASFPRRTPRRSACPVVARAAAPGSSGSAPLQEGTRRKASGSARFSCGLTSTERPCGPIRDKPNSSVRTAGGFVAFTPGERFGEIAGFPPLRTTSARPCWLMARPNGVRVGAGGFDDLGAGRPIAIEPTEAFRDGRKFSDGQN